MIDGLKEIDDEKEKLKHQKAQFPKDLLNARNIGVKIVKNTIKNKNI